MNRNRESMPPYNITLTRVRGRFSRTQPAAVDDNGYPRLTALLAAIDVSIVFFINSLRFMSLAFHGECIWSHGDKIDRHSDPVIGRDFGKIHER